jgi:hypothetical protein
VGLVGARPNSGEQVGEREAVVGPAGRTLALPVPAVRDAAFLADARFVLKPERNALVFVCIGNRL